MATSVEKSGAVRRQQRRVQHQDLSRAQLLDAAEEVFGRKGFHEATLKEVAELAGFSVGSVYSFFENKDDLFRQVYVRRGNEFMPALRSVVQSKANALEVLQRGGRVPGPVLQGSSALRPAVPVALGPRVRRRRQPAVRPGDRGELRGGDVPAGQAVRPRSAGRGSPAG